jgi:hypothetical protein
MDDAALRAEDRITGPYRAAIARFHLGEGLTAEIAADGRGGRLRSQSFRSIAWRTSAPSEVVASTLHPQFGAEVVTRCLCVPLAGGFADTTLTY